MPTILPIGIGVGLSGVSTFGSDVAGYQSATNPTSTKELFFRWTELGAWSPVMRTHHGTEPKLEWSWESDDDSTAHWVRYAKLHMALAPTMRGPGAGGARHGRFHLAPARRRVPVRRAVVAGRRRGDGGSGRARRAGADGGRDLAQRVPAAGDVVPVGRRLEHPGRCDGHGAGGGDRDPGLRARRDDRRDVSRRRRDADDASRRFAANASSVGDDRIVYAFAGARRVAGGGARTRGAVVRARRRRRRGRRRGTGLRSPRATQARRRRASSRRPGK